MVDFASVGVTVVTGLSKALLNFSNFLRNYSHSASALRAVILKTQSLFTQIERQQYVSKGLQSSSFKILFLASKLQAEMYELTAYLKGIQAVDKIKDQEKKKAAMKEIGNDIDGYTEHISELCDQVFETCSLLVDKLDQQQLEKKIRKALKKREMKSKKNQPAELNRGDPTTPNAARKREDDEKNKKREEKIKSRKDQFHKLDRKWQDELLRDLDSVEWGKEEIPTVPREERIKQREEKKKMKAEKSNRSFKGFFSLHQKSLTYDT